jgi:hypothetical protein
VLDLLRRGEIAARALRAATTPTAAGPHHLPGIRGAVRAAAAFGSATPRELSILARGSGSAH